MQCISTLHYHYTIVCDRLKRIRYDWKEQVEPAVSGAGGRSRRLCRYDTIRDAILTCARKPT